MTKDDLKRWQVIRDRLLQSAHDSVDERNGANAKDFVEAAACAEHMMIAMKLAAAREAERPRRVRL